MGNIPIKNGTKIIESGTPAPPPQPVQPIIDTPPNPVANLNGLNAYIQYDNLVLNDGTNIQELTDTPINCITKCVNNPNCQGLNIIKNTNQEQITTNGYNYQTLPAATCEYVSNINYSNSKTENPNAKFYAKKNNLVFENDVPYLLDINNKCLSLQKDKNGKVLFNTTSCNDYQNVTPVYFNSESDMIKINNNCLKHDAYGNMSLAKCNVYDNSHRFIYDHIYKSLRPLSNTATCLTKDSSGSLSFTTCNQKVYVPSTTQTTTFQNYYEPDSDDYVEYFENDYTVDMKYYFIYVILLLVIFFLVIVISSKIK